MRRIVIVLIAFVSLSFILSSATFVEPIQKAPDRTVMERGKVVYETYCSPCHMADGAGTEGFNPTLVKTKWVLGDKKNLIKIVIAGMNEEIKINNEVYQRAMPGNPYLKDQEVADLLTYVRNSFSNRASGITESEVKKTRLAIK